MQLRSCLNCLYYVGINYIYIYICIYLSYLYIYLLIGVCSVFFVASKLFSWNPWSDSPFPLPFSLQLVWWKYGQGQVVVFFYLFLCLLFPSLFYCNGHCWRACLHVCVSRFHCQTAGLIRLKFGMWSPSNWVSINHQPPVGMVLS